MKPTNVVRLDTDTRDWMREQSRVDRARRENKEIAVELVKAGIAILFVDGESKTPLTLAHDRLDIEIPADQREARRRAFYDKHGFEPFAIGATTNRALVRRLMSEKPDLLPAISCGPSGLIVIDNDVKERNGAIRSGVELFDSFVEQQGELPEGAVTVRTQGGGRHIYFSNPDNMGCSAGALKHECETDVKGVGGYVVAPGVTRVHDGKRYGSRADAAALIKAHSADALPSIPQFIRNAIGERAASQATSATDEHALAEELRRADLPDGEDLIDPSKGGFDIEALAAQLPKLQRAIDESNRSDCRFNLVTALRSKRPDISKEEIAAILLAWAESGTFVDDESPRQGEFNWRNVARDILRASGRGEGLPEDKSIGDAFSVVIEDTDGPDEEIKTDKRAKLRAEIVAIDAAMEELRDAAALDDPEAVGSIRALERVRKRTTKELAKLEESAKQSTKLDAGFMWGAEVAKSFKPADDIIEDLLPASGVVVLQGDSNVGKTFVAMEMLDCVWRGTKFLGRNVVQGGAMLIAGEGRKGMEKRLTALYRERPCDGRGFAVHVDLPNFGKDHDAAVRKLGQIIARYGEIQGHELKLLVLDNLTRLIGGEDMNLTKGVSDMFGAIENIAHGSGLCVVIIHHWNKSGKGAGSFAIRAAVDNVLELSEDKNGAKAITGDKVRDGPKDGKLLFKLRPVVLGVNQWGNDVSSCIVIEHSNPMGAVAEDDDDAPAIKIADRLEDRIERVIDVFEREGQRQKADDESLSAASRRVALQSGEIEKALNTQRLADGLEALGRSTVQDHIRAAVEADRLEVGGGTKARPLYRLKSAKG